MLATSNYSFSHILTSRDSWALPASDTQLNTRNMDAYILCDLFSFLLCLLFQSRTRPQTYRQILIETNDQHRRKHVLLEYTCKYGSLRFNRYSFLDWTLPLAPVASGWKVREEIPAWRPAGANSVFFKLTSMRDWRFFVGH